MSGDKGGVPDVPDVKVEDPHWKVGDGMNDQHGNPNYVIGQIAVVRKDVEKPKPVYDVVFFDTAGVEQGRLHLEQV